MDEGPYRTSGASACPRCAEALVTESSETPMMCGAGCGGWYPARLFEELLQPAVRTQRAPPSVWWKQRGGEAITCPACAGKLELLRVGKDSSMHRCATHGVWLDRGVREALEDELSAPLERFRSAVALAAGLARGDRAAIRDFAFRFVELEHRVAQLVAAGYVPKPDGAP